MVLVHGARGMSLEEVPASLTTVLDTQIATGQQDPEREARGSHLIIEARWEEGAPWPQEPDLQRVLKTGSKTKTVWGKMDLHLVP
jgi:hypothetical protein